MKKPRLNEVGTKIFVDASQGIIRGQNQKKYLSYPWIAGADVETTGFTRLPIPSIDVSITSPAKSLDVPAGVPVRMTSPGSSVIIEEI